MAPRQLNIVVRLIWFYLIGIPVGIVWLHVAWFAGITILGLPICLWMINLAPAIMTLRQEGRFEEFRVGTRTAYVMKAAEQTSFFLRVLWFLLVGWWASLFWVEVSLVAAATFIGIPLAFWMINRLPFVMTLRES